MMSRIACGLIAALAAAPAFAQTAAPAVNITPPAEPAALRPIKAGYTFFNPAPAGALRFQHRSPHQSNSPVTVDAGHVQYETDFVNYTHSNVGGVSTRLFTALDPVLKLGLTNRIDLEVQFNGYNWLDVNQPGSNRAIARARGAGDLVLRTKVNLFGNEGGPALALIPYVKFPTAARTIGNGHTEGGVIAPLTLPLPWDFTLLLESEVDVLKNAVNAGHHFSFSQLINVSHPIGPKLTASLELFSALGTDKGNPPIYTLDTALAYAVTDTLQLDIGANAGLNKNAPNLQVYTGIGQRF